MHKEGQLDISGNNLFKKIGSTSNPPFGLPDLIEKDLIFGIKSVANTGRMSKMTVTNLINLVRAAPPVPSNVTAVAYGDRNQSVKITWEIPLNRPDGSVYNNHSATFINRSKVNDITLAQKVGESLQSTEYIDTPSEFGTLYYWVKFISYAGVSGVASDPVSLVVDFWQVFVDDLFKPPAPTNLQVSGVVNSIILTWEQTAYSGGGGHDYAIIYGQKWLDGQLEPTFSYDTVISTVKDAKIYRHTVEPGERWIYWVKEKSRNSGLSDGYAGPAVAVTEYNPVKLIEAIEGHVTKSTLSTELQAEIDSVDPLAIQVMSNKIDDVYGSYTVKIDHNNHVSGYGLASEANNGTPISSFIVAADRFAIGAPTVANSDFNLNNQYPFIHLSAPTVVDGITMQPGTYLKRAFLADATITNAKIVTLDAEKITTGYLNADRIAAGSIKAGKIDSRGLSIYDEFGNVILAAGSGLEGLEWDYVKGAAKPQDGATRNVYVGIWTLGSGYLIGDIVQYEGSGWTCVQNHTATALNKPPESGISNTYWTLHALKGDPGQAGLPGVNGTRTAILDMYKWAEEQPISGFPSGTSTYTWSTAQFTAPATPNGWELVPPSPVVGQTLWMVRQLYSDQQTSSQTVIGWTANVATPAGASGPQGPSGVPGTRTGILELYKWAQTTPTTFPQGTSTYTWDTGSFTLPATLNGWTLLPGAPVAGYLLWACSERIIDNTTAPTSNKNWSTVTAYAIGGSGLNAISAIIDNESHSCPSSADGVTVNYVNSGCKITVFEGTTALIFNTGTLTAGQFSIGTPVVNPTGKLVVGARSGSGTTTATVAQHSAFLSDTDVVTITYPLTVKRLDGTNTSISKVQTITKSKAGVVGVSAKIAILTASAQIIHISKTAVVSPATITLSAFGQNLTGSPTFTVVTGTLSASMTGTGTTRTLNTSAVTTDSIVIKITWDGQEDYVTIAKVREGLDGSAGSSGADGDSIDIIFQRAATQPATPTASASIPSGWYSDVVSVPASSNPIWSSVGSKPSGASNYTWNTPLKIEGSDGYSGVSVVELTIFRRSASALTTPTGGAYNFATKVLTPPSGWSISVPVGTDPVYTSRATVTSTNLTATAVSPGTWTSPVISFQNGNTGVDGITIVLSNESHSLPASSDGVVSSYLNSGTTIVVYEGTTALSAVSPITGNSQFSIGTPTQSPLSTLTVGARTYAGTTGTVAAHSGMVNGTDSVTITYPISIRRANGTNIIINKTQTLTKSKTGSIGAQGPAVVVTSSRATTFTATDGTLDGSQADIVLTASVSGVTSPTYAWTFSGLQTNPTASTTNTQTITAAQFGTAKSATVTCTVNGTYKDQVTLVRLEKSTAAAGATVGSNLSDPFSTATWYPGHHTFETVPDGKVGSLVLRLNTGSSDPEQIRYIPLDRTKKYRVRFWARPQAGANGTLYFTLRQYISPGVFGPNNTGLTPYKPASVTPGVHNTNFGTDAWGEYSYIWTTADWQTDVTLVRPLFLRNYGGTVGYWEVQDLRFEEVTEVEAAKDSAAAANSLLADIAADSKLTPVEKQSVRAEWDTVYAERAGIRTQADGFSITAEKTAYDTAFQALGTYLNAGTAYTIGATPPSWIADAGLSSTTDIVGATFRSNWAALYTARQALLNKIAAEAAKRADWANVSGANKPEDGATKNRIFTQATAPTGAANGDIWIDTSVTPSVQKMMVGGAWQLAATVGATLAEFVVNSTLLNEQFTTGFGSNWTNRNGGGNASQGTGQGSTDGNYVYFGDNSGDDQVWYVRTGALIAYDSAKLYRMRVRARKTAGDGVCYIGLEGVAANRTTIVDPDGGSTGIGHYFVLSVSSIGPDWTEYAGFVQGKAATGDASARPSFSDPGKMHNNVAFVRPVIISNYPSRPGYTDVDYCILEEGYVRSGNIGGKIDAANVTTFIDNAAIGAAQIGSVELVGESAFKVRTNNSAGARMDMDSRRIKIFDANGTLRVQLGDLTV
jgi:hypothetical protein